VKARQSYDLLKGEKKEPFFCFVLGGALEMKRSREDVLMGPQPQLKRPQPGAPYPGER